MTGNTPNTPFDENVKDALTNFEASNASADWSRMESMLDAAPKVHTFNKKIITNAAIAVAVIAGGYLIYQAIPKNSPTAEPEKQVELKQETEEQGQIQPNNNISQPVTTTEQVVPEPTNIEPNKISEPTSVEAQQISKNTSVDKNATNTKNMTSMKQTDVMKEEEGVKTQKIFKMGNEPIFGDMLDSSKGIVGSTKEKEEVKKAAKEQTHTNTNWNTFLFSPVAPDSIRKNREKAQADSLKQK